MEEVGVTIGYLQDSIKRKDYHPELIKEYFLQRSEEAGEGTCTGNLKRLSSRRVRKGNSRNRVRAENLGSRVNSGFSALRFCPWH